MPYIIYDDSNEDVKKEKDKNKDNALKEYAFKVEKGRLKKLYGEEPIMCPVTSLEDSGEYSFSDVWINKIGYDEEGNPVDIDEISIIAHGNKSGIYFGVDFLKSDYLEDYPKEMKIVTINSCNAGNIDNESNIARVFLRTQNVEEVVAWDGILGLYTDVFRTCGLYYDQKRFYEQEEKKIINILGCEIEVPVRKPMGKLTYKLDENGEEIVEDSKGRKVYYECSD